MKSCRDGHTFETIKEIPNAVPSLKMIKCTECGKRFWLFGGKWLHEIPETTQTLEEVENLSKIGD